MNRAQLLAGLQRIATPETAPYEEAHTRAALQQWLTDLKVPFETDAYGNLYVRLRHGHPRRQVAFVAHMDHPAFRVDSVKGNQVKCSAAGGLPTTGVRGAKVVFPRTAKGRITGKVASLKTTKVKDRLRVDAAVIEVPVRGESPDAGDFAVFDLPAMKRQGSRLKLRAADDLAGCAAIVAAMSELTRSSSAVDFVAVFTRAEELGFHGALALAIEGRLPRDSIIVSVECSMAGGDIAIGKGPVIRLGDRSGPFDPRACATLTGAASQLAEKSKLDYQRAMMTGGTCEATAFGVLGYAVTGIALPLGNYHNQGPRGVAAEEIDVRDLEGAAQLITAMSLRAGAGTEDLDLLRNELILASQEGRERLREPVDPSTGYPQSARF